MLLISGLWAISILMREREKKEEAWQTFAFN